MGINRGKSCVCYCCAIRNQPCLHTKINNFIERLMAHVDEAHHLTGFPLLCEWLQDMSHVTIMSVTPPQELFNELHIDHITRRRLDCELHIVVVVTSVDNR